MLSKSMLKIGSRRVAAPPRIALSLHPLAALGLLLMFSLGAFAQETRIEQQMTPEQFKAAGLDQLSSEQLVNLNAWLNRTLDVEIAKAAESAKSSIEQENRGFLNFGKSDPIVARITGEFRGFGQGREYTLDNGQVWHQEDASTLAGVRLENPQVRITPALIGNVWYMAVDGYNKRAKVKRIK